MSGLSRRGHQLVNASPLPEYIVEHFARSERPWHPQQNPQGYVNLCIAENKLNNAALNTALNAYALPDTVMGYDNMSGNREFRERLAPFMARTFLKREFEPDHISVLGGAGTVLEMLFYALCDPGDGVLIPTPSYAGFWADLETRDELNIVTVDCASEDQFSLSTERLDAALAGAQCAVKALLFTTPNNPLGRVYSRDEIAAVVAWAQRNELALVVDEIYALSVFGSRAFTSAAEINQALGDDVHLVWGFSKDFGASGLRCGVLISENSELHHAIANLAYWGACSTHTQGLLSRLIGDREVVDDYLQGSQQLLARAYRHVCSALDRHEINYLAADAGFFLLCDLRPYLEEPSFDAEHALWQAIAHEENVNLTPGQACRIAEPGFFRLCYAAESEAAVTHAIDRLAQVIKR